MNKFNTVTTPMVAVMKKEPHAGTVVLHRGYVVGETTSHLKVWNPEKNSGDSQDPETASLYAKKSKMIWCEPIGSRLEKPKAAGVTT